MNRGRKTSPDFLAANAVEIVASMPCYLEENVNRQRGDGAAGEQHCRAQKLNALGYGLAVADGF